MQWKCYLVFVGCFSNSLCIFTRIVEIGQGKLRGLRSVSGQNRYYGIPYATSRRFQPPSEPPSWDGVHNAINRLSSCAQTVAFITTGTEDCLHLDVYTPDNAKIDDKLPVTMFIHGGAYYHGSKAHYDPEFLVTKNVVAVIINYRVGVLGFLCLNSIANLGLKDQVAALKWIHKNIAAFGGDPDNVTIFGQSAGASSASMHLLSESSKGLFHKAILLSGSPLAPWAFNVDPITPAFEDAQKLGVVSNLSDIVRIFSEAPLRHLLKATSDTSINPKYFKYSPCVDTNNTDAFFSGTPYDILVSGNFNKVPLIIGFADVEGMLFYGLHQSRTFEDLDNSFTDKLPSIFSWCTEKDRIMIAKKLREHYFGSGPINSSKIKGVVNFYSDWIAYSSIDAFSNLIAKVSDQPVYRYIFSYEGQRNFAKLFFGLRTGLKGASHSDDIFYIFKPAGLSLLMSHEDWRFVERFTTMLTSFMRNGDPTPRATKWLPTRWKAADRNMTPVLQLARNMTLGTLKNRYRGEFWLDLMCKYGLRGFVPCESEQLCGNETGINLYK